MENIKLNKIPNGAYPICYCSQGDKGRVVRVNLFDGVQAVKLSGSENIRIRYRLPNKNISSFGVSNTSATYLDVTIPNELTAEAGRVYCKLRIDNIGYKAFYIEVEAKV